MKFEKVLVIFIDLYYFPSFVPPFRKFTSFVLVLDVLQTSPTFSLVKALDLTSRVSICFVNLVQKEPSLSLHMVLQRGWMLPLSKICDLGLTGTVSWIGLLISISAWDIPFWGLLVFTNWRIAPVKESVSISSLRETLLVNKHSIDFTVASARPLDLALYADDRRWSTHQRLRKSSVSFESISGPPSLHHCSGTRKVAKYLLRACMSPTALKFCNPGLIFVIYG